MTTKHQYENKKEMKIKSKRIHCDICGRKFNKDETFRKHKLVDHNQPSQTITQNNQGKLVIPKENIIKENERHSRAAKTREN